MTTRLRSIFALTTTVALALLSAQAAAPATASRAFVRVAPQGRRASYRPVRGRSAVPAKSTVGPRADFNGDGRGDLAIGVPGEGVGSAGNAGGVNVLYGTASGLASAGNQFWSQASSGVLGAAETDDGFGSAVVVNDFNHDGFSDLAVGVPYEGIGSVANAGGVNIIYGSGSGLTSVGNQFWSQDSGSIHGQAEAGDEFGFALASRDFNGDGYADLAVGVPGQAGGGFGAEGAINVLYGSAHGLTAKRDQLIKGEDGNNRFGTALAAGDFDGDGEPDLAVGAPDAENGGHAAAGMVLELTGTAKGLRFLFHDDANRECREKGARCGAALAVFQLRTTTPTAMPTSLPGVRTPATSSPTKAEWRSTRARARGSSGEWGTHEAPLVGEGHGVRHLGSGR